MVCFISKDKLNNVSQCLLQARAGRVEPASGVQMVGLKPVVSLVPSWKKFLFPGFYN